MSIHPTACVHPDAQIAQDAVIGPYAVIEGPAVIGPGCVIQSHAVVTGHVVMGGGNLIGYGAVVGADPQDFAFQPEVRSQVILGERNRIREYCTLHRGTQEGSATVVGDDCFLMAGVHLGHNCRVGNRSVLANNALLGGYVQLGERVFVGGGCVFHQHIRVGSLAICQGGSAFSKDVPPFCIGAERNGVAGLNVVGLRRAGFSAQTRAGIKSAFDLIYRRGLNRAQALKRAADSDWAPEPSLFLRFAAEAGKRGLCDLLSSRRTTRTESLD
jgi:UDP-N-acetylglucosamine acyltransferase